MPMALSVQDIRKRDQLSIYAIFTLKKILFSTGTSNHFGDTSRTVNLVPRVSDARK